MSTNLTLLYLALFQTPKVIKNYTVLIINFALADFGACLMNLFVQARFLPSPKSLTYLLNGFCQFTGKTSCAVGVSVLLHTLSHQVYCLLISFCYRFYILKTSNSLTCRKIWIIVAIFYIPSFIQACTFWTNFVDAQTILPIAQHNYPTYDFSQESGLLTGIVDLFSASTIYGLVHICVPVTPVYITMFVLRSRIVASLSKSKKAMSKETRNIHSQLLKALTLQTVMPIFEWFGALNYVLLQLGFLKNIFFQYLSFALIVMTPSLAPFTYFLFVRPYRNFFRRHLFGVDDAPPQRFASNIDSTMSKMTHSAANVVAPLSKA